MPTKSEKDSLTGQETTGHEWDGIKELNNPLPRWWLYVFYATIVFSLIWFVLYPSIPWINGYFGGVLGTQQREILDNQMAEARANQAVFLDQIEAAEPQAILDDPGLLRFALAGGEAAFADNCAPCHGLGGSGQAQYPVLADDVWLWGGTLAEIEHTLLYGIRADHPETRMSQMPEFGDGILDEEQIRDVANHVVSLSGEAPDAEAAERGAEVFASQCAQCHGENGQGLHERGSPRLNDQVWLYGGSLSDVIAQITEPEHGMMPRWNERLEDTTIRMLTVYVHSLGGGQ
jgi:cytochrome c oxidase cbb3-type subunit 3